MILKGVRDGQLVEGAAAKNQTIKIGENKFIPGFEDNLVGLKKGDEKSFELTFPKNYGHKDLAGAKVTFKVKIHEVTKVELPKLDDKFAQSVGGFKTLSDLKADIKKAWKLLRLINSVKIMKIKCWPMQSIR